MEKPDDSLFDDRKTFGFGVLISKQSEIYTGEISKSLETGWWIVDTGNTEIFLSYDQVYSITRVK